MANPYGENVGGEAWKLAQIDRKAKEKQKEYEKNLANKRQEQPIIVNVKGVGKVKFPPGTSIQDIQRKSREIFRLHKKEQSQSTSGGVIKPGAGTSAITGQPTKTTAPAPLATPGTKEGVDIGRNALKEYIVREANIRNDLLPSDSPYKRKKPYTIKDVDIDSGAGLWHNFKGSFFKGDKADLERRAMWMANNPGGRYFNVGPNVNVIQTGPDKKLTTTDPYNSMLNTASKLGGDATQIGAMILGTGKFKAGLEALSGGLLSKTPVLSEALGMGAASMAGDLLRRPIANTFAADDGPRSSYKSELAHTLNTGLLNAGVGAVMGKAIKGINWAKGAKGMKLAPDERFPIAQMTKDAAKLKEAGYIKDNPTFFSGQFQPSNKFKERMMLQSIATDKEAWNIVKGQLKSVKEGFKNTQPVRGSKLANQMESQINRSFQSAKYDIIRKVGGGKIVTGEKGGQALMKGMDESLKKMKTSVSEAYKTVDKLAAKENPVFNVAGLKSDISKIRQQFTKDAAEVPPGPNLKMSRTPKTIERVKPVEQGTIEVSNISPQLKSLMSDIKKLPDNASYETIKKLRTRAFEMVEKHPWLQDTGNGAVKQVIDAFTKTLQSPTNASSTFKNYFKLAGNMAKQRFDVLARKDVQLILSHSKGGPAKLIENFGKSADLDNVIIRTLKASPDKLKDFQRSVIQQKIFTQPGEAIKNLEKWSRDGTTQRLMGRKFDTSYKQIKNAAEEYDKLKNSALGQLANPATPASKKIIEIQKQAETMTTTEIRGLMAQLDKAPVKGLGSDYKGRDLLKFAVFDDMSTNAMKFKANGDLGILPGKAAEILAKWKKSPIWGMLNETERAVLRHPTNIARFWNRVIKNDAGTSLEAAQIISAVKEIWHPGKIAKAMGSLGMNKVITKLMTSKLGSRYILGSGKNIQGKTASIPTITAIEFMQALNERPRAPSDFKPRNSRKKQ